MTFFAEHAFELPQERVFVPSFAAAIQLAQSDPRSIVLLPHVHETCSELTTSEGWELLADFAFPYANPPLFLAKRSGLRPIQAPAMRCAAIERLEPLLNESERALIRFEKVQTTQDAARACAAENGPELCITNKHGREKYRLETLRQLKHMIIWWMPFRRFMREDRTHA